MAHNLTEPGRPLTEKQLAVLSQIAQGLPAKTVARNLRIGYPTVNDHLKTAYFKLNARNAAHAVFLAIKTGQLPCSQQDPQTQKSSSSEITETPDPLGRFPGSSQNSDSRQLEFSFARSQNPVRPTMTPLSGSLLEKPAQASAGRKSGKTG